MTKQLKRYQTKQALIDAINFGRKFWPDYLSEYQIAAKDDLIERIAAAVLPVLTGELSYWMGSADGCCWFTSNAKLVAIVNRVYWNDELDCQCDDRVETLAL